MKSEGGAYVSCPRCGAAKGSILGPTLWNLPYDGVLEIELPDGVKFIADADNLLLFRLENGGPSRAVPRKL